MTPWESSRLQVGQVVVADWLLKQCGVKSAMVIVCGEGNVKLRSFLSGQGIRLWAPRKPPRPTEHRHLETAEKFKL